VLGFQSAGASPAGFEPDLPAAEATVFVQFSSGSTMQPKGCMLTAGAIAQQLEMLRVALAIDPEQDVCVAWLPMAHDMGLFGCVLFSCWTGHHVVLGTPQRFLAQPLSWLDDLARFGGTVTGTPNFALGMLARGLRGARPPRLGLDKLLIGGERVDPVTLREFRSAMTGAVDATALMPAYGLAEVVLAATVTPVGGGAREIALDAEAVAGDRFELAGTDDPDALRLCGAGRPIGDVRVSIDAPDGTIGEILVDSPSMAVGYLEDRRATEQRFTPAGLRTGDLGCMLDGELYVTGRQDDLIVVGGRNVYARDLEWALSRLDSVRAGNCAVVALDEGPARRLVALVEHSAGKADRMALARQMSALAVRGAGVGLDACLFLSPGALPKTASGKLQRYRCRELARTHAHVEEAIRLRV
jgi:acyl-CoA synthetase (AMP-forming)/AMP-acid ligase II